MFKNFIKLFYLKITKTKINLQNYFNEKIELFFSICFKIKVFLLSLFYIILLVFVLLFLTRLYILEIIELYALELVNPYLSYYMYGSGVGILKMLKDLSIENIIYNPSHVMIGNIIDCGNLDYLVEFQKIQNSLYNLPGSGNTNLAYDSDLNKHFIKVCLDRYTASAVVSTCPQIVKTKVENILVNNCYCFEVHKKYVLAIETLKLLTLD